MQNLKDLVKDFELRDQQNTNEINRLQREVDDLQDKNNNQVVAMNNVRNENNQQVAKINARYEDKIAKNNAEHNQQVIALKNQHSQELISLNDQINALKQANEKGEASSEDFFNLISKLLEGVQKLENEMGFDQEEINNLIGISNGIQEHYNENHVISHDDYNALNHIVEELFIHAHDMNQANISERNNMNQFLNALNERINAMIPNDANYDILNDAINYFTNDGIRQASYHGIAILFNILKTQRQTIRNYENALISARQGAFLAQRDAQRRSSNLYHAGMAVTYIVSSIAFFWLGKKVSDHQHEYLAEMALQALTYEENNKALNQQLEESIKNEENAQQENEMLQEENKNLKKENMKLKNENARAKQALRSVNAKAKTYEEKYYNLNSYFEEFKTNSTNKYNNLFNLYQDKDKKYQHVEKMLKKNDFDINKLINSNTKLEEENRNLTRKNDELQSLNKQYDHSYKSLLNKTQNVTKILDMVKKRNEKGTNELMKIIYQLEEKDKVTSKDLAIFKEKTNYWMQKFIEADQNRKALADSLSYQSAAADRYRLQFIATTKEIGKWVQRYNEATQYGNQLSVSLSDQKAAAEYYLKQFTISAVEREMFMIENDELRTTNYYLKKYGNNKLGPLHEQKYNDFYQRSKSFYAPIFAQPNVILYPNITNNYEKNNKFYGTLHELVVTFGAFVSELSDVMKNEEIISTIKQEIQAGEGGDVSVFEKMMNNHIFDPINSDLITKIGKLLMDLYYIQDENGNNVFDKDYIEDFYEKWENQYPDISVDYIQKWNVLRDYISTGLSNYGHYTTISLLNAVGDAVFGLGEASIYSIFGYDTGNYFNNLISLENGMAPLFNERGFNIFFNPELSDFIDFHPELLGENYVDQINQIGVALYIIMFLNTNDLNWYVPYFIGDMNLSSNQLALLKALLSNDGYGYREPLVFLDNIFKKEGHERVFPN